MIEVLKHLLYPTPSSSPLPPPPVSNNTTTSQEDESGLSANDRRVDNSDSNEAGGTPKAIRTAMLEAFSDLVVIHGIVSAIQAAGSAASSNTGSGANPSVDIADGESSDVCSNWVLGASPSDLPHS